MPAVKSAVSGIADLEGLTVSGRLLKTARLRSEFYVRLDDAAGLIQKVKRSGDRVDLLTFLQDIGDPVAKQPFYHEPEKIAVLPITTYDHWFKKQLYNKPRNMLRKAVKSGVDIRTENFTGALLEGIKSVYDDSPIRQGRRNRHYHKDLETIENEHSTFLERSEFVAAYSSGEFIGFAKVTFSGDLAVFMNFLSKISHRDKAPNNALLAKVVEICAERGVSQLVYGLWGRGTGGLIEFKLANGFRCAEVPRYYVPLTILGSAALRAGVHRGFAGRAPERFLSAAAGIRERWNVWKFRRQSV